MSIPKVSLSFEPSFNYQVGGAVPPQSQTYVRRQADEALFTELLQGEFCYVFNSRQMGKSSLRVQVMAQLREAGVMPGALDLTAIGTQQVTVEQWYGAIAAILSKQFQLETNLRQWWRDRLELPPPARLGEFIGEVLLAETQQPLVILIDEIDSILALKFATDDFFALIRSCYNRRADNPAYQRLSFALFGVATPGELIGDKNRTPFNVGQGISLQGFKAHEVMPLVEGLAPVFPHPHQALERILAWTGGQPFLTQKLCKLVVKLYQDYPVPRLKTPTDIQNYIDDCVEQKIICNWEAQDEPEHLKTIRDRLLYDEQKVGQLLTLYRQIWQAELPEAGYVQAHESPIQTELILSGVAEKRQGYLRVKNRIYQRVFNQDWVDKQLNDLRPYASSLNAWVDSNYQDESRLLRGQALQEALDWTQQKGLGDLDYRYLSASQDLEQREIQDKLERARLAEAEARLEIERQSGRRQRRLLAGLTVALVGAIALGIGTFRAYQQTAVSEIKAMMAASKGSFASNQQLDALIQALQARQNLQNIRFIPRNIRQQLADNTQETLQQVLYGNRQFNRITAHTEMALGLDFSPDGQWIATSGIDETTKIWTRDGTLKHTLTYGGITRNVTFSPDSQYLAAANFDSDIYIWSVDGTLQQKLKGHDEEVWDVAWSPDGQTLVSVGRDKTVRLWSVDGDSLQVLEGHEAFLRTVDFHPNGDEFASMSVDGTINIWGTDGTLLQTFTDVSAPGMAIAYSPDGDLLVAGYGDHQVRLWHRERGLLETLSGHEAEVATVAFSPDGQQFASAGVDRELKLWSRQGSLLTTLKGHESHLRGIAFSPEGTELGSVGEDGVLHLWQVKTPFRQLLPGHGDVVWRGNYAPRSSPLYPHLATVSGMDIRLWDDEGVLVEDWVHISPRRLYSLALHPHEPILVAGNSRGEIFQVNRAEKSVQSWQTDGPAILALAYSPDGRWLLVSDGTSLRVWAQTPAGESILYHTFDGHQEQVWDLAFSPDGSYLLSHIRRSSGTSLGFSLQS
ncbi:AAA-like domain-containing protein [Sodalinema gerasimenkoae]|uniref:AAA-like domain-containing protein n=1 Tax=Sodalinema gerasimenkoae TaxID=2862348 RepID=UPI00135B5D60|nr:AAA-like domain-containing protein [Sodalinema gerasimenkoae]